MLPHSDTVHVTGKLEFYSEVDAERYDRHLDKKRRICIVVSSRNEGLKGLKMPLEKYQN